MVEYKSGWGQKVYRNLEEMERILDNSKLQSVPEIHHASQYLFAAMKLMEDNFLGKEKKKYNSKSKVSVLRLKLKNLPDISKINLSFSDYLVDYLEIYTPTFQDLPYILRTNIYMGLGYLRRDISKLLKLEYNTIQYFTNSHKILSDSNFVNIVNTEINDIKVKNNLS